MNDKIRKSKAGKIAGVLVVLFVLIALCAGGALWVSAIRVPETPSPLAAVAEPGTASIKLAWDKSPSQHATAYRIMIGLHPKDYTSTVSVGNEGTVTLTSLKKGTRYYIVVVAMDALGNQSAPSNEVEVVTPTE